MKSYMRESPFGQNIHYFIKWTVISVLIGIIAGSIGTAFGHGVLWATGIWRAHHWTLFLMPVAGLLIVWLYHVSHEEKNRGTNMVLESISSNEEITVRTGPLIFVTTILSHLVSASAGKEGAALQLGGSLGNLIGKVIRLDEKDKKIAVMCGMSACFAAVFGTPLAAGVFSMEVVSIGVIYYAALVPCLFSSFIGAGISGRFGLVPEHYEIGEILPFGIQGAGVAVLIGAACAAAGVLLCICLHQSGHLYSRFIPNLYLRVLAGSAIFIALTLVFQDRSYNGGGLHLIERCFDGEGVPYYAFLLKILFTAVALGAGFRGGEIVPTLCTGATLGFTIASLFGLPVGLCSAVGMVSLFVSVTNCPVSTVLMAFELFGFEAMPYFSIAIAVSFTLSGYYGLYSSQKFIYSKIRTEYINRKSN